MCPPHCLRIFASVGHILSQTIFVNSCGDLHIEHLVTMNHGAMTSTAMSGMDMAGTATQSLAAAATTAAAGGHGGHGGMGMGGGCKISVSGTSV